MPTTKTAEPQIDRPRPEPPCQFVCLSCGNSLDTKSGVRGHWAICLRGHSYYGDRKGRMYRQTAKGLELCPEVPPVESVTEPPPQEQLRVARAVRARFEVMIPKTWADYEASFANPNAWLTAYQVCKLLEEVLNTCLLGASMVTWEVFPELFADYWDALNAAA